MAHPLPCGRRWMGVAFAQRLSADSASRASRGEGLRSRESSRERLKMIDGRQNAHDDDDDARKLRRSLDGAPFG